ncbi:MFS transporter [Micromonospora sediminimaris]|uniref:MFS transporter n=1 Tax=Micromonospora sediminimaris TaxID=547162 RepID=UPI0037BCD86D
MRALVSARLGADFAKLWTASAVSNIGDGITMAAGPLLVASITESPALIAGAVFVQQLPWLLFALLSGAYVDRIDRRRLVVAVNLVRAVALATLTVIIATDTVTVVIFYAVHCLLGTGETLADTAMGALLPSVVVVFSAHGMVWGITVASLRQRLVPSRLLGRVGSAYAVLDLGGAAVGSLLGGLIAGSWGSTAPFWIAGVTMAVVAVAAWRPLAQSPNRSETIEES